MGKSIEWFGDEKGNLLPAIKILDCVFVLTESQQILHLHEEELSTKKEGSSVQYFAPWNQSNLRRMILIPESETEFLNQIGIDSELIAHRNQFVRDQYN